MSDIIPSLRVGFIGVGTITRAVIAQLDDGAVPSAAVVGALVRGVSTISGVPTFTALDALLAASPTVVVEAAGHDAVADHAERCLENGVDVLCLSVGALADDDLRERLAALAGVGKARLRVPSGAIAGLDALSAARDGLESVLVEQRKPPASLLTRDADSLTEPLVVFEGTAREVVSRYPRTTNVAAAVALAGIGFDRTRVRVVADPRLRANVARVQAAGTFGQLLLELRNVHSASPLTSAIVADSVVAALRRLEEWVVLPA